MKQIFKILFFAQLAFIVSCGGNSSVSNDSKEYELEDKTDVVEKDKIEAPQTFIVKNIVNGDEICGLKVKNYEYTHEQQFSFVLEGEITLSGSLAISMVDDEIQFTPDAQIQELATLKFNNIEKPLFIWTSISNINSLLALLTDEQKTKIEEAEGLEIKLCLKNYYIGAGGNNIGAGAEFVRIIE